MQKAEFIIILFPPGFGGNSLRNLLGLYTGIFSKEYIEDEYKNLTVHALNNKNLQSDGLKEYFSFCFSKKIKTFFLCGHLGEYLQLKSFFNFLPNKKIIIFNWDNNSIEKMSYRMYKLNYNYLIDSLWIRREQSILYEQSNIAALLGIDLKSIITINLKDFLKMDVIPLLDFITVQNNLPRSYNVELCNKLHNEWLKNNRIPV